MFGTHDLPLFALTVLVVNATPGVDMAFTLLSTLRGGVKAGLTAAAGICAGCSVHTAAAALGLAALLVTSGAAFSVIKWAGAAYLLWLAFGMLRAGLLAAPTADPTPDAGRSGDVNTVATFRQGFLTNLLNPKIALFFLALLPQFIDVDAPAQTIAFLFLGAWFIAQGFTFLALLVLLVAPLRRWRPRRAVKRSLQLAGGGLFALLAARLALAERP